MEVRKYPVGGITLGLCCYLVVLSGNTVKHRRMQGPHGSHEATQGNVPSKSEQIPQQNNFYV